MSLNPALDQKALEKRIDNVKVCGTNRGPHDYIPIRWVKLDNYEEVTHLLCRICFTRVSIKTLLMNFSEAKI